MFLTVDFRHTYARGLSPSEENDTASPHPSDKVNGLLSKSLPSLVRVAIGLMRTDGKTRIEHQNTTICPWYEQTAIVGRRLETRVALLDAFVDVDERWRRSGWRTHGEGQAVGLVIVMIRILANDDDLHVVEGGVPRPRNSCLG